MASEQWVQAFKVGTHTDSSGNERGWTEADLDVIVSRYNSQTAEERHDAPVVIGHPVNNSPAYGWVECLKRNGIYLYAKLRDVQSDFKNMVKEKLFNKISISLYPDLLLRHIGFLGAVPPAIKGLASPEFQDTEYLCIEFQSPPDEDEAGSLENNGLTDSSLETNLYVEVFMNLDEFIKTLVSFMRSSFGEEVANATMAEIQKIKAQMKPATTNTTAPTTAPNGASSSAVPNTSTHSEPSPEVLALQKKLEEQSAELLNKEQQFQEQIRKQAEQIELHNTKIKEMNFNSYFDSKVREGRLTPAQRVCAQRLYNLTYSADFDADATGGGDKPANLFEEFVSTLPVVVEFGESVVCSGDASMSEEDVLAKRQFELISSVCGVKS